MTVLQAIVLALIQGFTEFLPISSSAHLILPSALIEDWPDQGIYFDITVHIGTLGAVIIYFRKMLLLMLKESIAWGVKKGPRTENVNMFIYIIAATIPTGICGILCKGLIENYLRSPLVIATTSIVFGLVLWGAQIYNRKYWKPEALQQNSSSETAVVTSEKGEHLKITKALLVGCAQSLALIPGTSRSGITLTAGYFLKLNPKAAAEFSFLISIPIIILSALLMVYHVIKDAVNSMHEAGKAVDLSGVLQTISSNESFNIINLTIGLVISFVVAFIVIKLFLDLLNRLGLVPYVIYRVILGLVLFYVLLVVAPAA